MISFDKIVNKLLQKKGNIVLISELGEMVEPGIYPMSSNVRKTASKLVDKGILHRLRNGIFFINKPTYGDSVNSGKPTYGTVASGTSSKSRKNSTGIADSSNLDSILLKHYWEIVHSLLMEQYGSVSRVIVAGPKSLETLSLDFSPPPVLHMYADVPKISVYTIIPGFTLRVKPIQSGKLTSKNLFPTLKKFSKTMVFPGEKTIQLRTLIREAAVLDSLLLHEAELDTHVLERYLKRNPFLDRQLLGNLVQLRYISSINRLREIAQNLGITSIVELCKEIIRDEGSGCYLSVGLRK